MGEARQRVDLVHELRQLRGAEELLDGRDDRADVHQRGGRDGLDVLGGHALAHHALHAAEADAHLVLDQLADAADAAVGEVVLVVEAVARLLLHEVEHVADGGEHLVGAQHVVVVGVAADAACGSGRRCRCWKNEPSSMVPLPNSCVELGDLGRRACGRACSDRRGERS